MYQHLLLLCMYVFVQNIFLDHFSHAYNYIISYRLDRYTPLACAAKAGNYDIMAYLLSIKGVSPEGVDGKEQVL